MALEDEKADTQDVLDLLDRESKEFDKDAEIARIRSVFRNDAYAVLDLQPGVPESDIKRTYRLKSLLIHPDKTTNPLAPDAFDRLKKAQTELLDEKLRTMLDEHIADARGLLIRQHGWTTSSEELKSDDFKAELREKTKWVLMENEKRMDKQRRGQMQEEGRLQRKLDEEVEERKRKRDHQEKWEATREERIGSWRDFQKGKTTSNPVDAVSNGAAPGAEPKKKKKKMKPIG